MFISFLGCLPKMTSFDPFPSAKCQGERPASPWSSWADEFDPPEAAWHRSNEYALTIYVNIIYIYIYNYIHIYPTNKCVPLAKGNSPLPRHLTPFWSIQTFHSLEDLDQAWKNKNGHRQLFPPQNKNVATHAGHVEKTWDKHTPFS